MHTNGAALTLTYDEALDGNSVPVPGDFAVTAEGGAVPVASGGVAISGLMVTVTLSSPVAAYVAVTLDYTPGTNPIRDAAPQPNDAVALTAKMVTNDTPFTVRPGETGDSPGVTVVVNNPGDIPDGVEATLPGGDEPITITFGPVDDANLAVALSEAGFDPGSEDTVAVDIDVSFDDGQKATATVCLPVSAEPQERGGRPLLLRHDGSAW